MLCIQKRLIEDLELDQPNSEKLVPTLEDNTLRDTTEEHAVICETSQHMCTSTLHSYAIM